MRGSEARLDVFPKQPVADGAIRLRGDGWPHCPVTLLLDDEPLAVAAVHEGSQAGTQIVPDESGAFMVSVFTLGWKPGRRRLRAVSDHAGGAEATRTVPVKPPALRADGIPVEKPFARSRHFFGARFGHLGAVPPGLRQFQVDQVRAMRAQAHAEPPGPPPDDAGRQPVPGVCNWTPLGPSGVVVNANTVWSGRALAVAFDPTNASVVYLGTACGGVWKSTDGGATWSPKSDHQVSPAIGAIAVDPNNPQHVIAGTGQYNNQYIGTYYGNGALRSNDGGETWSEHGAAQLARAEVSAIAFDPVDTTGQRIVLSSSVGIFESVDGGTNWTLLRAGDASGVVLFRPQGGGPPNRTTAVGAFNGSGLWTATRQNATWGTWTQITSAGFPTGAFDRITLGQQRSDPRVIYAMFGRLSNLAGLARTLNGTDWTKVDVRLAGNASAWSTTTAGHTHSVVIPATDLGAAPVARTYTTSSAGTSPHTHTVSLTAAQMETLAGGGAVVVTTDADATGHQHQFPLALTGQAAYDACVGVHPTDPNTVFIGEVSLWRCTTGGGTFTPLPILHTDNHGFAFEPGSAVAWVCGDGGAYRSTDNGSTWVHRNRDLATLEYIGLAQHPQWETVLLGGTQDNGTHRYTGTPAWRVVAGGDGGFAAIDPVVPTRMYHQYIGTRFYRSDDAGATWAYTNQGVTPGDSGFYTPFAIDPANHEVCYFGGRQLWRRDYATGADWQAVTTTVNAVITAIAVDPADTSRVYVGTGTGRVWRVQRTGATWASADVTATDISAGLPLVSVSDLVVDPAGVVWATIAAVYTSEAAGEFSNDHVFRRAPGDAQFASRSGGLAQANPVNSIVVDPANANRLFVGCDVGVFRTEDAGLTWTPWDEGLPNAPVFDLVLHHPRRLLRAATHGRSVWERPIDTATCPLVDLYVRDTTVDSGRVQPTPSGVPDPITPSALTHWWQSPDIKVDAPEPAYQTALPIGDYVGFEAAINHRSARRGQVNRFYAQVHNRGVNRATNVLARAFFAPAAAGLPSLPSDFWTGSLPWIGNPSGTQWTPVGPARSIAVLEAAEPGVVEWDFTIPATAPMHSCLLLLVTCAEDPLDGGGILDPNQLVLNRKQVALKNLQVLDATPGMQPEPIQMELHNPGGERMVASVELHWGTLPRRAKLAAVLDATDRRLPDRPAPKAREDGFPTVAETACGHLRPFDRDVVYEPDRKADEATLVPEVEIPPGGSRVIAVRLDLPKRVPDAGFRFDVVQRSDGRVVGGCTYVIDGARKLTARRR